MLHQFVQQVQDYPAQFGACIFWAVFTLALYIWFRRLPGPTWAAAGLGSLFALVSIIQFANAHREPVALYRVVHYVPTGDSTVYSPVVNPVLYEGAIHLFFNGERATFTNFKMTRLPDTKLALN